jgi:hypothetical protein
MFYKKYNITILNNQWVVIKENVKLKTIPNTGELLLIDDSLKYHKVSKVIHDIKNRHEIFLVIEEFI